MAAFGGIGLVCLLASTDWAGSYALELAYRMVWRSNATSLFGAEQLQTAIHVAQKSTHVLLFGVLGILAVRGRHAKLVPVLMGVALCVAAELSQFATATREPKLADGFLNVVAFSLGAVLGSRPTSRNIA